jgi:hypothetical protein
MSFRVSAAEKYSVRGDLLKSQHDAEKSAFARNIHGGWVRIQAKKGGPFIPGPSDRVDERT